MRDRRGRRCWCLFFLSSCWCSLVLLDGLLDGLLGVAWCCLVLLGCGWITGLMADRWLRAGGCWLPLWRLFFLPFLLVVLACFVLLRLLLACLVLLGLLLACLVSDGDQDGWLIDGGARVACLVLLVLLALLAGGCLLAWCCLVLLAVGLLGVAWLAVGLLGVAWLAVGLLGVLGVAWLWVDHRG